jgi:hypothetical protein
VQSEPNSAVASVEEDIHRLETGIRQLKIQYDMFFAGSLKRQPVEQRAALERTIRKYSDRPMRNYAQRFRFSGLVSRFNSFAERWGKTVRQMEEGDHRHEGLLDKFSIRERMLARARVGDDVESEVELRRLHGRYVDAMRRHGAKKAPSYEGFARGILAKTKKLRDRAGCAGIELRLVVRDDDVQLKARPRR